MKIKMLTLRHFAVCQRLEASWHFGLNSGWSKIFPVLWSSSLFQNKWSGWCIGDLWWPLSYTAWYRLLQRIDHPWDLFPSLGQMIWVVSDHILGRDLILSAKEWQNTKYTKWRFEVFNFFFAFHWSLSLVHVLSNNFANSEIRVHQFIIIGVHLKVRVESWI